jgi:hypothetical protein
MKYIYQWFCLLKTECEEFVHERSRSIDSQVRLMRDDRFQISNKFVQLIPFHIFEIVFVEVVVVKVLPCDSYQRATVRK